MTLIGDIVGSRAVADRAQLQGEINLTLTQVEEWLTPLQPLRITVGDEFQGGFASLADAVLASLLIRIALLTGSTPVDSRYGIGSGVINLYETNQTSPSQDGPGWWAARASIEYVHERAQKPRSRTLRTWLTSATEDPRAQPVNAFLICRDALVSQMRSRELRLLAGLMRGHRQVELASYENMTQSTVSAALNRSGAYTIMAAQQALAGDAR